MTRHNLLLAIAGILPAAMGAETVPAFPGAEGFGTETGGGRGGSVYIVTSLDDYSALETPEPGTLRYAIDDVLDQGCRMVVFEVGGTITLESSLVIDQGCITIAGQTALGGGIELEIENEGSTALDMFPPILIKGAEDVVIRHMRIRPGFPLNDSLCASLPAPGCYKEANESDPICQRIPEPCQPTNGIDAITFDVDGGDDAPNNVVLDHLSLAWATDELLSVKAGSDITVQWSILAEAIEFIRYDPGSDKGKGLMVGVEAYWNTHDVTRISTHHNLFASNSIRNPQMMSWCRTQPTTPAEKSDCAVDVRNNVSYNWHTMGTLTANVFGHHFANVVGNYFKPGPNSHEDLDAALSMRDWNDEGYAEDADYELYEEGNVRGNGSEISEEAISTQCLEWLGTPPNHYLAGCDIVPYYSDGYPEVWEQYDTPEVNTLSGHDVYVAVLDDAGARFARTSTGAFVTALDANDTRVIGHVSAANLGSGAIIDTEAEVISVVYGWGGLPQEFDEPADTDRDGMPDAWEDAAFCLDSEVPDGAIDSDNDGYTNLEEYLNVEEDLDGTDPCACVAGDTGLRDPGVDADAADTGGDNDGFEANPTRARADGAPPGGGLGHAKNNNGPGDRHRYYDYGVPIRSACDVKGIEVRLDWWLSSAVGTNSMSVELSWDGGTSWTTAKTASNEPTVQTTNTLGSSSDTWGRAWTADQLTDPSFRVRLTANSTASDRDFMLDWIPVRVTYGP